MYYIDIGDITHIIILSFLRKGVINMEMKKDFVSKVSEEELKNLAGGNDEITPQSTVVCVSLRLCKWSIKYCPSFKKKCLM